MKFKSILELDAKIEKIIKKTVKAYYTDWKNYDRPYYMKLKGSTESRDKIMLLVVRKYGTYLFSYNDLISSNYNFPLECIDYYFNVERYNTDFYIIDLSDNRIEKLSDEKYIKFYRSCKNIKDQETAAA